MIYVMVEKLSGSVIPSQVLGPLRDFAAADGRRVDLIAMEEVGAQPDNARGSWPSNEELRASGLHVWTFPHYGRVSPRTYASVLRMLVRSARLMAADPCRTVMARNMHSSMVVLPLRWLCPGSLLVLDLRGAFVEELVLSGIVSKNSVFHHLLRWANQRSYLAADHILCVSSRLARHVLAETGRSDGVSTIPCSVDLAFGDDWEKDRARVLRQLGLEGKLVAVYAGSLTSWNLIGPMLDLFQKILRMPDVNAHFLFLTSLRDRARKAFADRGIPEQSYTVLTVPHGEIGAYLAASDVGMVLREDNVVNRVASPVKVGEYLASGVPVCLTPNIGDLSEVVTNNDVGVVVDPLAVQSEHHVEVFIRRLKASRAAYRDRCRQVAEQHYNRDRYLAAWRQIHGEARAR